jgi:hypothetical protein
LDGAEYPKVGPAATKVAIQASFDLSKRRFRCPLQKCSCSNDHAADTVAALRGLLRHERRLQRVKLFGDAEALAGRNFMTNDTRDRCRARADFLAIQQNGTGTALGKAAAEFWRIEPKIVPQDI